MSKSRKSPFEEVQEQIDIRLGGLLGELGSALTEAIEKLDANGDGEVHTSRTFDSGRGPVRASAGIRIRPLGGGTKEPTRAPGQPINTPQTSDPAPTPNHLRDISATILEGAARWQLIADLPGVDQDGITIEIDDDVLTITAEGRGRRYHSNFTLPGDAKPEGLDWTVKNGILEVTVPKSGAVE